MPVQYIVLSVLYNIYTLGFLNLRFTSFSDVNLNLNHVLFHGFWEKIHEKHMILSKIHRGTPMDFVQNPSKSYDFNRKRMQNDPWKSMKIIRFWAKSLGVPPWILLKIHQNPMILIETLWKSYDFEQNLWGYPHGFCSKSIKILWF